MSQMRNPVDFERALLTKMCVDRDTIGDVLKNALTVRHFHDPENGQVFEYVVSSYRRYGKPPGKDLVLAYFPGFRWIDNEALPGALIEELQQRQFHTEILAVTEDMRRSLADGKGLKPSEVFDALRQKVQEIGLLSSRSDAVSYFPDAIDSVMAEYEKARSSKGLTGIELPWESLNLATMGLHPQEMVVVSARPKCGKCVRWDTEIADPVTGELLTVQDFVRQRRTHVISVFDSNEQTLQDVAAYLDDGVKECFRVKTQSGRVVSVTAEHPFLTPGGWRKCAELRPGVDVIGVPRTLPIGSGTVRMPDAQMRVLALMIAEGHVLPGACSDLSFTNRDPALVRLFRESVKGIGCGGVTRFGRNKDQYRPYCGATHKRGEGNPVRNLCVAHGVACLAPKKRFPAAIWRLPKSQLAEFVGLLWSCDGCVVTPSFEFGVSSEKLARDMAHALLRFSVFSRIRHKRTNFGTDAWVVQISGSADKERFRAEIPLVGVKAKELREVVLVGDSRPRRGGIPASAYPEVFDALPKRVCGQPITTSSGYFRRNLLRVLSKEPEYAVAELAARLSSPDVEWDPVVSVEWEGLHQVYDLMVARTHNFVAADVYLHNTWWMEYVASFVANSGHRVLFKTIEMSVRAINQRMAAILSGLQYARLREGSLTSQDEDKLLSSLVLAAANQFPLTVIGREPGDAELATLRGHCERIKPEVLFIDGVYLLTARDHEQQATLSDSIKRLSQELDIPVIVSTQLNRDAGDEKETKLSDLAFSDSYGQNADLVIALRRGQEEKALDRLRHDLPGQRESKVECYYTNWVLCSDFSECKVDSEIATISDGGEETKETPGVSE